MAGFAAIAAAGKSIERLLNVCFEESQPIEGKITHAVLVRTDDFSDKNVANAIGSPALSIFLYRIEAWSRLAPGARWRARLSPCRPAR